MNTHVRADQETSRHRHQWLFVGALAALAIGGMILRAGYAVTISPDFDEFFTILGARSILQHGVPLTPAGTYYTRGLLFSYVDALSLGLLGLDVTVARLPSVILGGATIMLIGLVGRRMFTARAGLLAAAFLAELGQEESGLARVIHAGYRLLGLLTFFTAGPNEVRAWTVRQGSTAPRAAGRIHTDFERGFIRAQVIAFDDFIACDGEQGAREAGKLRLEGKDYVMHEGDVTLFRFNV